MSQYWGGPILPKSLKKNNYEEFCNEIDTVASFLNCIFKYNIPFLSISFLIATFLVPSEEKKTCPNVPFSFQPDFQLGNLKNKNKR